MAENQSSDVFLHQNCRENWPTWTCVFGNVCGLSSTTLWFLVLLPQVWKNFRRKSVQGLSVLWATANFTASLVNLFFVFKYAKIPLYGQISSVYCPILEFTLLIQFWVYGRYQTKERLMYVSACLLIWAGVIVAEFLTNVQSTLEYLAIALWCIETFPQVILNMKLHSASGQSVGSACIATVGKTTDLCSNNILVIPIHYVIMTYFSSSVAFVNGLQVVWYYQSDFSDSHYEHDHVTAAGDQQHAGSTNYGFSGSQTSFKRSGMSGDSSLTFGRAKLWSHSNSKCTNIIRILCLALLCSLLTLCVFVFVWNIGSYLGLLAPLSIVIVLGTAKLIIVRSFNW